MVPPQSERNDWIKISGPPGALPAVKEELMKKVKTIEDDRKDRVGSGGGYGVVVVVWRGWEGCWRWCGGC